MHISMRHRCPGISRLLHSQLRPIIYRGIDREQQSQLFFHISEVRLEPDQAIEAGSEVSFATVPDTQGKGEGNPIAVRIQLLPDGTLEAEKRLPGTACPPPCSLDWETMQWGLQGLILS